MRTSFFYGYVILALSFINLFFMRGTMGAFSVFYVALLEEFNWSHGKGATIASVNALVYALTSPLIGWFFDRFGPRVLMPLGGALIGAGLLLSGRSSSLWEFYLYYGILIGMGQGGLGFVSHSALISHWFRRRRGTALGVATMGLGLGVLLIVPLAQTLISRLGWRTAFMLLGGLILLATTPVNAILQRFNPEAVGQLPDGDPERSEQDAGDAQPRPSGDRGWSLRSALSSFPYWSIMLGHLALGTGVSMFYTHVVAHLVDQGFSKLIGAWTLGLIGLARIPGTLFWGFVSDRFGRDRAYAMGTLMSMAGVVSLVAITSTSSYWSLYLFLILYGIGHAAGTPTYGSVIGDIFGGSKVGTIFGFLETSFGAGMTIGPWFGGYVYDLTGSYRWAFALGLLSFLVSYLGVRASLAWHYRELARKP